MIKQRIRLLVVDIVAFSPAFLDELKKSEVYDLTVAVDVAAAWRILDTAQQHIDSILLGHMPPACDGLALLKRIRNDQRFAETPVIFQAAVDSLSEVTESLNLGAYYCLPNPVQDKSLFVLLLSAVCSSANAINRRKMAVSDGNNLAELQHTCEFMLRTLAEARALANALSKFYPQPQHAYNGICELLVNAVEHGNLGLSYQEKTQLLREDRWENEIDRRLALAENVDKRVTVVLAYGQREITLTISDCGAGFDSRNYMEMSPERACDPNGRGIALSRMNSFDSLVYNSEGNQLVAVVKKSDSDHLL